MLLNELKVKEMAYIVDLDLNGKELKRLLELGFVQNTKISVVCFAPNKKTVLVSIRGYLLALNIEICQKIRVERWN